MLSSLKKISQTLLAKQQSGFIIVILLLAVILTALAGSHVDRTTGKTVNNFFNPHTLMQTATDASFFAIMAVGATMVIISNGIDLSVGSIYALCGVVTASMLRYLHIDSPSAVALGIFVSLGLGLVCGMLNGLMVVGLEVHPFIITLGTMWIFRGIAFVMSKAESILVPSALTAFVKANLGLSPALYPAAMLIMIAVTAAGAFYLSKTVMGRHIYAIGGNAEASRYAGLHVKRITVSVFAISGLTAGIAAFMGSAYYGSASCGDATGYELYVIASAVVGGASLSGGKGNAVSAMLGAILIVLIRQSIRTLHFDQNYEWIIIGAATIIAVVLDKLNTRLTLKRAMK
ncbi:MAG: ABC transporter permease [Sedimentisphaerales bacterium]